MPSTRREGFGRKLKAKSGKRRLDGSDVPQWTEALLRRGISARIRMLLLCWRSRNLRSLRVEFFGVFVWRTMFHGANGADIETRKGSLTRRCGAHGERESVENSKGKRGKRRLDRQRCSTTD